MGLVKWKNLGLVHEIERNTKIKSKVNEFIV